MSIEYKYKPVKAPVVGFIIKQEDTRLIFKKTVTVSLSGSGALKVKVSGIDTNRRGYDPKNLYLDQDCAYELRDGLNELLGE